ncbi:MAG: hypothetical protein A3J74_06900 [Elusimicrobia bacterium RIFCSPHIGHO2_02_FULL_57_9]|nr:MAG: hypothetical protein A3J74_06900 [Elusimicrobia bacterium RIFCSPHIGHO2_02_FULL_57_9]
MRVLITGASCGLGREMALLLGREGCQLALTGRRRGKLEQTAKDAGGECLVLPGDVGDYAAAKAGYAAIRRKWGGLDWAVLNAGISKSKNIREFSAETCRRIFEVNVIGAANWLEQVLPDMIQAGSGTIAGVASLAGWRGWPNSGAYCASKAALEILLESARLDLRGTGVRVVIVCPGFVKSELTGGRSKSMPFILEGEDGARRIINGIKRGKKVVHFPWQLSLPMKYLVRPMPDFLYDFLATQLEARR